jgi:hypothetical protein
MEVSSSRMSLLVEVSMASMEVARSFLEELELSSIG